MYAGLRCDRKSLRSCLMEDPTIPKPERTEPDKASNETTLYETLIGAAVGDYIIEEYIGQGGEAVVFRARGASTGKQYALKVFGLDDREQPNVSGALPEARAQSRVEHRNVVEVSEPGLATVQLDDVEKEILYIPMQYSSLGNCQDVAPFKDTQITTREIESLIDLLDGLRSVHEKE